ncbi:uncharacterized protein LOC144102739 [Amblyomma americanum]
MSTAEPNLLPGLRQLLVQRRSPSWPVSELMAACRPLVHDEELAAYFAPGAEDLFRHFVRERPSYFCYYAEQDTVTVAEDSPIAAVDHWLARYLALHTQAADGGLDIWSEALHNCLSAVPGMSDHLMNLCDGNLEIFFRSHPRDFTVDKSGTVARMTLSFQRRNHAVYLRECNLVLSFVDLLQKIGATKDNPCDVHTLTMYLPFMGEERNALDGIPTGAHSHSKVLVITGGSMSHRWQIRGSHSRWSTNTELLAVLYFTDVLKHIDATSPSRRLLAGSRRRRCDGFTLEATPGYPHGRPALRASGRGASGASDVLPAAALNLAGCSIASPMLGMGRGEGSIDQVPIRYLLPPGCGSPLPADPVTLSGLSLAGCSVPSSPVGLRRLVPAVLAAGVAPSQHEPAGLPRCASSGNRVQHTGATAADSVSFPQRRLLAGSRRRRSDGFTLEATPAYPHGTPALGASRRVSAAFYHILLCIF